MNLQGKRTYLFLASLAVSLATGFAARRGIDLGLDPANVTELTTALAMVLAGGAAWARRKANLRIRDEQHTTTPRPGK